MIKGFFISHRYRRRENNHTAALVKAAQYRGLKAMGMKPIETGCQKAADSRQHTVYSNGILIPPDGKFLREISGAEAPLELITRVRFENPLAPMPASEREGIPVDIAKIKNAFATLW